MLRRLAEERDAYVLGLLRVAFAGLLLVQTYNRAHELQVWGYFGNFFHMPLWPESFVPSERGYAFLLGFQALGCVLGLVGVWSRPALFASALAGLFCFFGDRLQYHNNRYELLLLTLLVSLTPCDRTFLLFGQPRRGVAPRWAAWLVGAQISVAYLASSLGKLFDPDWRGGTVMQLRFAMGRHRLEHYAPAAVADFIAQPWFAHLASLAAISNELFLAIGLWFPRTRALALWLGVMFHVGIEVSAHVELFSYTMLCGYLVFVTPEQRERRLSWDASHRFGPALATLFSRFDWLARFQHERVAGHAGLLTAWDRDGKRWQGLAAWRELARATPALFPLWLPLSLLTLRERKLNDG